ncbi:hypothetical protein ACEN2Y_00520 (plasmid) [Ralstonia solanacearum]|uniref:hypothetical protein n=1 Tax=Ralstonia solanacearum TaxID=305 RepID=UPI00321693F3
MTNSITSLADLREYAQVELGGYDWVLWQRMSNGPSLNPSGDRQLPGCRITEVAGQAGEAATYDVLFEHATLRDLRVNRRGIASLEDAVTWATGFQWATRQAGSLTWWAESAEARQWHAKIGASQATVFQSDFGASYTVTREMQLGNQLVQFKITDLAYVNRPGI